MILGEFIKKLQQTIATVTNITGGVLGLVYVGAAASAPAASSNGGKFAIFTDNGWLFRSNGTAWDRVGGGPIAVASYDNIVANYDATIHDGCRASSTDGSRVVDVYATGGVWTGRSLIQKNKSYGVQRYFAGYGSAAAAGKTFITHTPCPLPTFDAVALVALSYDTVSGQVVTSAKVAASPAMNNNGTALTWASVTWDGGSASKTLALATGSGTTSNVVPAVAVSDIIPVTSVARTDTPSYACLLQSRMYFAAASVQMSLAASVNDNVAALRPAMASGSIIYTGDAVSSIVSQVPLTSGTWFVPAAVKFYGSAKIRHVAGFGDSLTRGTGTTGNAYPWFLRSCLASGYHIGDNMASHGQNHAYSMLAARTLSPVLLPDIATLWAWSPNDSGTTTSTGILTMWADFVRTVETLLNLGIIVVGCTSPAWQGATTNQNNFRKAQNDRMRAMAASGMIVLADFDAVITNPSNDIQINPSYNSGDGTHFNDAGNAAMATVFSKCLAYIG